MNLSDKEVRMIVLALQMRRNYIQTGDVVLSATDIANQDPETMRRRGITVKALTTEQMRLIIDTEDLIKKLRGS